MFPTNNVMFMACGSFSPPTHMHFRMFELAKDYFLEMGHNVVGGIISPVHDSYGKRGLVVAKHRVSMLKNALQTSNWIRLSDWECNDQEKWTKTRHSLQYHQNYLNSYVNDINGTVNEMIPSWIPKDIKNITGNVQLKLLCGADLLESFATPGLWAEEDIEAILVQHGLIVITRSGSDPARFIFDSDLLTKHKKNITIITNWVPNEVSSSIARKLLGRGLSVKYLMDDLVIEYIKKHQLYGTSTNDVKYVLTPNQNTLIAINTSTNQLMVGYNKNNNLNIDNHFKNNDDEDDDYMDETDCPSTSSINKNNRNSVGQTINNVVGENDNNIYDKRSPRVFCCGTDTALNVKSLLSRPGGAVQIITNRSGDHTKINGIDGRKSTLIGGSVIGGDANDDNNEVGDDKNDDNNKETKINHHLLTTTPITTLSSNNIEYLSDNHLDKIGAGGGTLSKSSSSSRYRMLRASDNNIRIMAGDNLVDKNDNDDDDDGEILLDDDGVMLSTSDRTQNDLIQFVFTSHGIRVISDKEYVV